MFSRKFILSLLPLALALSSLRADDDLATFARWLPGTYSSAAFAQQAPGRSDVRIHIVPLWSDAADGPWFYLEQAIVATPEKPYRQAILHAVKNADGTLSNENWEPADKAAWIGAWQDAARLARFTRADLKAGTTVILLHRVSDSLFKGGTPPNRKFPNHYKGAATFTNLTELTPTSLYSWDRGWKEDGTLAWGPETGGYRFEKLP